jgi:hypothetical protein
VNSFGRGIAVNSLWSSIDQNSRSQIPIKLEATRY